MSRRHISLKKNKHLFNHSFSSEQKCRTEIAKKRTNVRNGFLCRLLVVDGKVTSIHNCMNNS